jgi:hypothetical protein
MTPTDGICARRKASAYFYANVCTITGPATAVAGPMRKPSQSRLPRSTFKSVNARPGFGQKSTPICSKVSEKPVGRADDIPGIAFVIAIGVRLTTDPKTDFCPPQSRHARHVLSWRTRHDSNV